MQPQTIEISQILVEERQRIDLGDLESLKESLKKYGQIQPILLRASDKRLVAGGRRLAAATSLGWTHIQFVFRESLTNDQLHELELEENLRRKDFTWQETVITIAKIHEIKTRNATLDCLTWGQKETAEALGLSSHCSVSNALKVVQRLDKDPTKTDLAWKCDSVKDCVRLIVKEQMDEATKRLAEITWKDVADNQASVSLFDVVDEIPIEKDPETGRRIPLHLWQNEDNAKLIYAKNSLNLDPWEVYKEKSKNAPSINFEITQTEIPLSKMIHHADCCDFILSQPEGFVDHIITDWPYGIDVENIKRDDMQGAVGMTEVSEEHDVQENMALHERFLPLAYRAIKDGGFFVTWCDIMQWQRMYDLAIKVGFRVQRWPFVWCKTSSCGNQTPQYNFTKNIEVAMICRKPNALLTSFSPTSYIECGKDDLCEAHPFGKPFKIWEKLINHVSSPGQKILEPFSGSGSGVISMLRLNRAVIACEKQDGHFNDLTQAITSYYESIYGGAKFVKFI